MSEAQKAPEAELLAATAGRLGRSAAALASTLDDAGVETVRNWLKGYRTVSAGRTAISRPNRYQLARLAQELKLTAADLRTVGRDDAADELETVGAASHTDQQDADEADELRYRRPEGVSDQQWAQIRARSEAYLQGLIDQAASER